MARKIILKEDGLAGSGTAPSGYRYFGYDGTTTSEKYGPTISSIGGDGYSVLSITLTQSQIFDISTTPLQLLPALTNGKYYTGYIDWEYTYGGVEYTFTSSPQNVHLLVFNSSAFETNRVSTSLSSIILTYNGNAVARTYLNTFELQDTTNQLNSPVGMKYTNNPVKLVLMETPLTGNGTLRAIINYKVVTFGT